MFFLCRPLHRGGFKLEWGSIFQPRDSAFVMYSKISLSLFFWVFKKYLWISLACFLGFALFTGALAQFTSLVPKNSLFFFLILLFIFGLIEGIAVLFVILYYFIRPLASSAEKIKYLAQQKSFNEGESWPDMAFQGSIPDGFYDLNKNLQFIYNQIQKKSMDLNRDKAELKTIMAAVSDAIIAVNADQKIIFSNLQSQQLFLISDSEKLSDLHEVIPSHEIIKGCKKCFDHGTSTQLDLSLNVGEHRQSRIFEVSISPLTYKEGHIDGAVIVFFDATEIRNTEKSHIDFVANVSHELKTPLTSIKGFVETMISDLNDKKYDQIYNFLDIVDRNVMRLMGLIDDLLSLSHIDSVSDLKKQEVNTREVTAVACETIDGSQHKINYIYKADTVLASQQWLEQVLYNLVNNAVKYTPAGSQIDIIWEKHPHFILLTVKDNGHGIPLQHQHRIFERFYRADEGRSRDKGGTGIGLAIVKQVMEKHGGHVYLTSRRRGKGAKLTCTFPR